MVCEKILKYSTNGICPWFEETDDMDNCKLTFDMQMFCPGKKNITVERMGDLCPFITCSSSMEEIRSECNQQFSWFLLFIIISQIMILIGIIITFHLSARFRFIVMSLGIRIGTWIMNQNYDSLDEDVESLFGGSLFAVSYTHLTLPTKA